MFGRHWFSVVVWCNWISVILVFLCEFGGKWYRHYSNLLAGYCFLGLKIAASCRFLLRRFKFLCLSFSIITPMNVWLQFKFPTGRPAKPLFLYLVSILQLQQLLKSLEAAIGEKLVLGGVDWVFVSWTEEYLIKMLFCESASIFFRCNYCWWFIFYFWSSHEK